MLCQGKLKNCQNVREMSESFHFFQGQGLSDMEFHAV